MPRANEGRVHDTPPPAASPRAASSARRTPRIALIAAVARNGVIGVENRLPWRLPDDMKRFRALTMGHSVIMGRRTFESLGAALPGRQNIVVTSRQDLRAAGCESAASLTEAIARATLPEPVFVIGGEALYRAALPHADLLFLTEIDRDFAGDTRFPEFERGTWRETARERKHQDEPGGFDFAFAAYERVRERD
ncbi:MAG TPA: dihydrofolate reductase [Casimicrobiaceae bacterium]|nr:dihydrofolate reductase [Casimicrobiaceae bacterium]